MTLQDLGGLWKRAHEPEPEPKPAATPPKKDDDRAKERKRDEDLADVQRLAEHWTLRVTAVFGNKNAYTIWQGKRLLKVFRTTDEVRKFIKTF